MEVFHQDSEKLYQDPMLELATKAAITRGDYIKQRGFGFLVTDFKLKDDWIFDEFIIERSIDVFHNIKDSCEQTVHKTFISPVFMPERIDASFYSKKYMMGLSTIVSFATRRPVYVTSYDFGSYREPSLHELTEVVKKHQHSLDALINYRIVFNCDGVETQGIISSAREDGHFDEWKYHIGFSTPDGSYLGVPLNQNFEITHNQCNNHIITNIRVRVFDDIEELALVSSSRVLGPGSGKTKMSDETISRWFEDVKQILSSLYSLPFESSEEGEIDFVTIVRAMRLYQLSLQNYKIDFDLSYALLVSSIESVATKSFPDKNLERPTNYTDWKQEKKSDLHKELFNEYNKLWNLANTKFKHKYLGKRFRDFILKCCPTSDWYFEDEEQHDKEARDRGFTDIRLQLPKFLQNEPMDIERRVKKMISQTYDFRSGFYHAGKATEHQTFHKNSDDKFEVLSNKKELDKLQLKMKKRGTNTTSIEEFEKTKVYLITHKLMTLIAMKSIRNCLISKASQK